MLPLFTFRTNGVNNPNQSVQDLRAGANMSISVSGEKIILSASGGGGSSGVSSFNERTGAVTLLASDLPNLIDVGNF